MSKYLIVVDMQNDFIDGALGTDEAISIVPNVERKIKEFDGKVYFTRDTHFENYMESLEGSNLPVPHCIKGTHGWQVRKELDLLRKTDPIDKLTFGSSELAKLLVAENEIEPIESITFVGLCTDICVISNVFTVRSFLPEVRLIVDASCCAGVTPESHNTAIVSMKTCQIQIDNE